MRTTCANNFYEGCVSSVSAGAALKFYSFGAMMPGRSFNSNDGRYGFAGKEKNDEIYNSTGTSYDFGARQYDPRLGKWWSIDPLFAKYPSLSPYCYGANSPIWVVDKDGEDIIVLSAPDAVGGLGHAAVLIGNDKEGWTLYSKNGTTGSIPGVASSGPANKHPQNGVYVGSLDNFALNYNLSEKGEVEYKAAFRITTDKDTDAKMKEAAGKQVNKWYDVTGKCSGSCIDVASDALDAGGLEDGSEWGNYGALGIPLKLASEIPNERYKVITEKNKGTDVTKQIMPSAEAIKAKQQSYAKSVADFAKFMKSLKQGAAERSKAKEGKELAPADATKVSRPSF